jgi:hypothetical protein
MKLSEILLPKNISEKGLNTSSIKKIDGLQARMDLYVDKICKLASGTAKDFLKTKLKADYNALKDIIRKNSIVSEAIHTLPLTHKDFELVKKIMENPIPAAVAQIYIMDLIDDDELNDQLEILENTEPSRDIRPLIVDWFRRVMPDQICRFEKELDPYYNKEGNVSVLHGYDSHSFSKGSYTGTESSGNAYGKF